jgi:hypothetical protein
MPRGLHLLSAMCHARRSRCRIPRRYRLRPLHRRRPLCCQSLTHPTGPQHRPHPLFRHPWNRQRSRRISPRCAHCRLPRSHLNSPGVTSAGLTSATSAGLTSAAVIPTVTIAASVAISSAVAGSVAWFGLRLNAQGAQTQGASWDDCRDQQRARKNCPSTERNIGAGPCVESLYRPDGLAKCNQSPND